MAASDRRVALSTGHYLEKSMETRAVEPRRRTARAVSGRVCTWRARRVHLTAGFVSADLEPVVLAVQCDKHFPGATPPRNVGGTIFPSKMSRVEAPGPAAQMRRICVVRPRQARGSFEDKYVRHHFRAAKVDAAIATAVVRKP